MIDDDDYDDNLMMPRRQFVRHLAVMMLMSTSCFETGNMDVIAFKESLISAPVGVHRTLGGGEVSLFKLPCWKSSRESRLSSLKLSK